MNKAFTVYLARGDSPGEAHATLTLPALPYTLRDALEKVRLREGDELYVQIESWHRGGFLSAMLMEVPKLHELNLLAEKLSQMDAQELKKFEGLVTISVGDSSEAVSVVSLINIAASTSAAMLIPASSDEELGKYCVKNDMIPALKDIPENVREMLDYDKIGFIRRNMEDGVFLDDGKFYVVKTGEIQTLDIKADYTPEEPDYSVLMEVVIAENGERRYIKFPMEPSELGAALGGTAEEWRCADCRVPSLSKKLSTTISLDEVCAAAEVLAAIPEKDLAAYKAMVQCARPRSLDAALALADFPDQYLLSPQYSTPAELAAEELSFLLSDHDAETLLPFVDLHAYGSKLMQQQELTLTEYGLIERRDKQPVQGQKEENTPSQGGMTMGGWQ